jgi:uncharacterized membrane protein YgaE (UPF0421/DUF939 family)
MKRILEISISIAKWVALAFIFTRFHGTWVGLTVVILMGILLFRVDRTLWRIATNGSRS